MPRTRTEFLSKKSKKPILEESESEESSVSEVEEPIAPPQKKVKSKKVVEPEPESESSEEEESEEEESLETLLKNAQDLFNKTYEKKIKRSKGKGESVLPQNTNLYIKLRNNATGKSQWKVVVYGKGNVASDEALKATEAYLDGKDYKVSFRVEKPRLF